jgi:hypothetical protein
MRDLLPRRINHQIGRRALGPPNIQRRAYTLQQVATVCDRARSAIFEFPRICSRDPASCDPAEPQPTVIPPASEEGAPQRHPRPGATCFRMASITWAL